mmetsp:Transcript_15176/g.38065  ORF Transcript_15176/g.38065 Transcript_15176/m.38065 type:complete len:731 (-) Transcript_15176:1313-3505(-)
MDRLGVQQGEGRRDEASPENSQRDVGMTQGMRTEAPMSERGSTTSDRAGSEGSDRGHGEAAGRLPDEGNGRQDGRQIDDDEIAALRLQVADMQEMHAALKKLQDENKALAARLETKEAPFKPYKMALKGQAPRVPGESLVTKNMYAALSEQDVAEPTDGTESSQRTSVLGGEKATLAVGPPLAVEQKKKEHDSTSVSSKSSKSESLPRSDASRSDASSAASRSAASTAPEELWESAVSGTIGKERLSPQEKIEAALAASELEADPKRDAQARVLGNSNVHKTLSARLQKMREAPQLHPLPARKGSNKAGNTRIFFGFLREFETTIRETGLEHVTNVLQAARRSAREAEHAAAVVEEMLKLPGGPAQYREDCATVFDILKRFCTLDGDGAVMRVTVDRLEQTSMGKIGHLQVKELLQEIEKNFMPEKETTKHGLQTLIMDTVKAEIEDSPNGMQVKLLDVNLLLSFYENVGGELREFDQGAMKVSVLESVKRSTAYSATHRWPQHWLDRFLCEDEGDGATLRGFETFVDMLKGLAGYEAKEVMLQVTDPKPRRAKALVGGVVWPCFNCEKTGHKSSECPLPRDHKRYHSNWEKYKASREQGPKSGADPRVDKVDKVDKLGDEGGKKRWTPAQRQAAKAKAAAAAAADAAADSKTMPTLRQSDAEKAKQNAAKNGKDSEESDKLRSSLKGAGQSAGQNKALVVTVAAGGAVGAPVRVSGTCSSLVSAGKPSA